MRRLPARHRHKRRYRKYPKPGAKRSAYCKALRRERWCLHGIQKCVDEDLYHQYYHSNTERKCRNPYRETKSVIRQLLFRGLPRLWSLLRHYSDRQQIVFLSGRLCAKLNIIQRGRRRSPAKPFGAAYLRFRKPLTETDPVDAMVDYRQPLPRGKIPHMPKGIYEYLNNLILDSIEPELD